MRLIMMSLVATKPVFGVSDKAGLKPVYLVTETGWKIEISPVASLDMLLSEKRIAKAMIRLRGSAGWSAPLLFACLRRQGFLRRGLYKVRLIFRSNVSFYMIVDSRLHN